MRESRVIPSDSSVILISCKRAGNSKSNLLMLIARVLTMLALKSIAKFILRLIAIIITISDIAADLLI